MAESLTTTAAATATLIAVVDDDRRSASYLARLVKQSGYEAIV